MSQLSAGDSTPIEVFLLLCKALRDEEISEELHWRGWGYFNDLYFEQQPRPGYHQVAIIAGGGSEAPAVTAWLRALQAHLYQPRRKGLITPSGRGITILEVQSPNSRLNIRFAVRLLREKEGFLGPIRLYLYSSPYHVEGLCELRYKLSEVSPFSFVEPPSAIFDVLPKPTPYHYPACGIEALEYLAKAYLLQQGLRLLWENLRAMSGVAGQEEERMPLDQRTALGIVPEPRPSVVLLPESVRRLEEAVEGFRKLLQRNPNSTAASLPPRVAQAKEHLQAFLGGVEEHREWLQHHTQKRVAPGELAEWQERVRALETWVNPTHVRDIDPDTMGREWEMLQDNARDFLH